MMSAADVASLGYRLVVAPCVGRFVPGGAVDAFDPVDATAPAPRFAAGEVVGVVTRGAQGEPVRCPHAGTLIGLLVLPGQPVRAWQPLLWVRVDDEQ